jgi:hypothetical protein
MQTDPLEAPGRRRAVVVTVGALAIGAFVGSVSSEVPTALPGVTLGSPFLLHIERALALGALVAVGLIFLMRGWEGYFPSKLSTAGAEYATRSATGDAARTQEDVGAGLAHMRRDRLKLAESLHEDMRAMERRIVALEAHGRTDESG